jgi:UDP-N-acetylglucosamine acyltransferase
LIDENAKIHPNASIAKNVTIGPWSVIGADVEIAEGTEIGPHVVIQGPTKIGRHNKIYQFSSIGENPQCLSYRGEKTTLEIGDHNTIREFCTLNRGTVKGIGRTHIGSHNFLMAYVHIAHDCHVGNHIIFANNASLSGHVVVEDQASFGGFSAVHQFCRIGAYSFVSGETSVVKDVPPFILVSGHPGKVYGLNTVGLKRKGFNGTQLTLLRQAYLIIYREGLTTEQASKRLKDELTQTPEVQALTEALSRSTRGIVR